LARLLAPEAMALATAPPYYSSTLGATAVQYAAASTSPHARTRLVSPSLLTTEWTEKRV
jgi:hypothetical protein